MLEKTALSIVNQPKISMPQKRKLAASNNNVNDDNNSPQSQIQTNSQQVRHKSTEFAQSYL